MTTRLEEVDEKDGTPGRPDGEGIFSGVRWVAVGQLASQIVRLGVTVLLARLLRPEDFGLISMATAFTSKML